MVEILEKSLGIKILINYKSNYQTLGMGGGNLYHPTPVVTWSRSLSLSVRNQIKSINTFAQSYD